MTTSRHVNSIAEIAAGAVTCAAAATLITSSSALTVVLTGLSDEARRMLGFGFGGVPHTPADTGRILLHNARLASGTLVCAVVRPRLPAEARTAVDLLLATLLTLNASVIGVAFGAYGHRLLTAIALHAAPEFAALSLAAGAYMSTRKQAIGVGCLAAIAALCALLVSAAAALETYVSLGSAR
jgi:hypothetical protein